MRTLRTPIAAGAAIALVGSLAAGVMAQDEPAATIAPTTSPEGITWILEQQVGDDPATLAPLPPQVLASLVMADGRAGGSSGCNSWFADYVLDGETLTFGPAGATLMACPDPQDAVERAFFANLAAVASWASDGATLTLNGGEGTALMQFAAAPEASVVGSWVAQGINNGLEAVETTELTPLVTAVFDADGQLSGSDGCNSYFTSYEVDGESITIAPEIATTLRLCEGEGLGELSAQYFAALGAATTWSVDASGALELRDASDALQVRFVPAE